MAEKLAEKFDPAAHDKHAADPSGGGEHGVDDRIAANSLERRIGALIEAFDGGAETALTGRASGRHAGASSA